MVVFLSSSVLRGVVSMATPSPQSLLPRVDFPVD